MDSNLMRKNSVLIVEDEKIVSMTLSRLLASKGYEIAGESNSGEKAVETAISTKPDLVLMDIRLSGKMDGIEAASRIREQMDVPVIYLTANTDKATVERAKYTQPYGYIVKPFESENIFLTVEMALYKHRMEKRLRESEARNRKILDVLPDYIFILDGEGKIRDYRRPSGDLPGPSTDSLKGCFFSRIFEDHLWLSPHGIQRCQEACEEALSSGERQVLSIEYLFPPKGTRYLDVRITSLGPNEVILIARDVTEERMAKEQMLDIVLQTQERERQRFASDLHDSLGQLLSAIKLNVESMAPKTEVDKEETQAWEHIGSMLDEAVRETRQISHSLMSDTLRELGLTTAVKELCKRLSHTGLKINFQVVGEESRLERRTEIGLYRVIQELLNNVIRHSAAKEVDLQLVRHEKSMVITLEDDGKGFDPIPDDPKGGIGLKSVKNRISMLNGVISIESHQGRGTAVSLEVPI